MEAIDEGGIRGVAAIHDIGFDTWVVDVSGWTEANEPDGLRELGSPALVCFGGHGERPCLLDGTPRVGDAHGVVFEIVPSRAADAAFVRRFRRLISAEMPVHVVHRPVGVA